MFRLQQIGDQFGLQQIFKKWFRCIQVDSSKIINALFTEDEANYLLTEDELNYLMYE
jgi:hypothetical protein